MERELEVLQQIQDNEYITQRDLAESTGLSLGTINLLMKKMIKTGLIKIEKLNPQKIRYILTPEGMAEKASKTYQYIVKSYKSILQLQKSISTLIEQQNDKGIKIIYLYGQEDEVYKVIHLVLNQYLNDGNVIYKKISNIDDINMEINIIFLVWNTYEELLLNSKGINNINILKYL